MLASGVPVIAHFRAFTAFIVGQAEACLQCIELVPDGRIFAIHFSVPSLWVVTFLQNNWLKSVSALRRPDTYALRSETSAYSNSYG